MKIHLLHLRGSKFAKTTKPGDLIEILRGTYNHWAIYIGENEVVHLCVPGRFHLLPLTWKTIDDFLSAACFDFTEVRRAKLSEVVGYDRFKVNNLLDDKYEPRDPDIIVKDALAMVGMELPYSVTSRNCEHFVTNLRYDRPESRQFAETTKPGDLIEILRGTYNHWAIYIGENEVVHLCVPGQDSNSCVSVLAGLTADKAEVRRAKLSEVVGYDRFKVNNLLDDKYEPRDPDIIVKDALAMVGMELPYSVTSRNCEHFVTNLRYDRPESRQVGIL
ncbi:hypothetical protein L3Q82_026257 [Scortum barcoo]|uniref:Uncharacterized protein n=1 Tax=Scortum barcoo TaxID=214431 RepID=A0ACB8WI59_9TELE|nr:hypothetical protein L3Q82_026257 [Scortum barcoo]